MADQAAIDAVTAAYADPASHAYLGGIAQAEGTASHPDPYAVKFGGGQVDNLDSHPGTSVPYTQKDGKKITTSAAGAYQFEKGTWEMASKALGLSDFSPESQDKAALYLSYKNGSLPDILGGNYSAAMQKDGKTWASLPTASVAQPHRDAGYMDKAFGNSSVLASGQPQGQQQAPQQPDMSATPIDKLISGYQRATDAGDHAAAAQIYAVAVPKIQDGLQRATDAGDDEAVSQLKGMLNSVTGSDKPSTEGIADKAQRGVHDFFDGVARVGNAAVDHPVDLAGNMLHGAADTVSLGFADKAGAGIKSLYDGSNYDQNLAAIKQQEQGAGAEFTAGQLGGAFIPGVGSLSMVGKAAELVPTTSRAVRTLAGMGAGAAEGSLNYLGHNTGPVNLGDLAANAGLGTVAGALPGLLTGPTAGQVAATAGRSDARFMRAAGGDANLAAMRAEISQDFRDRANNASTQGVALGAADANAIANKYTQGVAADIRNLPTSEERTTLLNALNRPRGLDDAEIAALRTSPAGNAAADAITKHQLAMAMTAPTPANSGAIASGLRMAIDNGALHSVGQATGLPGAGFLLNAKPVRTWAQNALGSRALRLDNIGQVIKAGNAADGFLARNAASTAGQSAQDLQALVQQAQAAQAGQMAAKAAAQRTSASQDNLANSIKVRQANIQAQQQQAQGAQATQQAAQQSRQAAMAQQAQANLQSRQAQSAVMNQARLDQQAQAAQQAQGTVAAQQAASQANLANSIATRQANAKAAREAMAAQQAQTAQQAQEAMAAQQAQQAASANNLAQSVKVRQENAQAARAQQGSQQVAQTSIAQTEAQAKQAAADRLAARIAQRQKGQAAARSAAAQQAPVVTPEMAAAHQAMGNQVANGDFSQMKTLGPQLGKMLDHTGPMDIQSLQGHLQNYASQGAEQAQQVGHMLTPGSPALPEKAYYAINDHLKMANMGKAAAKSPAAMSIEDVLRAQAHQGGVVNRQQIANQQIASATNDSVKKFLQSMKAESDVGKRQALYDTFLKSHSGDAALEGAKLGQILINYGK